MPNFAANTPTAKSCFAAAQKWLNQRGWGLTTIEFKGVRELKRLLNLSSGTSFVILDVDYPNGTDESGFGSHSVVAKIEKNQVKIVYDPANAKIKYATRLYAAVHFLTPTRFYEQ